MGLRYFLNPSITLGEEFIGKVKNMVNWNVHRKEMEWGGRKLVLETGKIVLSGDAKVLMNDDSIKKAYLGE